MNARDHAVTASQLLVNVDQLADRLANLTPDQRLQMTVAGEFKRINDDMEWTARLAQAHALTALALAKTDLLGP